MDEPIARQHLRELAERKSKSYELLLALEQNPAADDSCFESVARVVDRLVFHEISLAESELAEINSFFTNADGDLGSLLSTLALAVGEAEPDRGRLQLLVTGYPEWLNLLSPAARPHFLGILPNIAALLGELKESGMQSLIRHFNGCASAEDFETLTGCIARYQETSGEILLAAAELAELAIHAEARPMVASLLIAVPPDVMFDSKDARLLLPAMAKLQASGAALCIAVARHDHSSALNLARQIPNSLAGLAPEMQEAFLKAFRGIVDAAGISLVGYGSKQLPDVFRKAGIDQAREFVEQGIAIARRYGKVAAEEFFEQRTAAAKQALPR